MVHIVGRGVLSPLGFDAKTSYLAFNAGINQYQESTIYNQFREPIISCFVPESALPELADRIKSTTELSSTEKHIARLCHHPINECLGNFSRKVPIPLFLSVSETLPGSNPNINDNLLAATPLQSSFTLDAASSQLFTTGRAGGLQAVAAAFDYFAETGNDFALVGGVETYHGCHDRLHQLEWEGRLHSRRSFEGFVPGEAAGFLLLCSEKAFQKYNPQSYLKMYKPGLSEEPGHLYSDEPYTGEALAKAVSISIAEVSTKRIDTIYSTMNGESFFAKEFGIASIRNSRQIDENLTHRHPADCYGDIGAASAPVLLSFICEDQSTRHTALWCSSDMAHRGAIYVHK